MQFIKQSIRGVWVIEPRVYADPRGYFMESYKEDEFESHIGKIHFIQDNESKSTYGVLRGLHAQAGEAAQAKLVRVIIGSVLDVVVDLRIGSETYGKYVAVELSETNKRQLFIPRGLYHGFLVLSQEALFSYKVDNTYLPAMEVSLNFADPEVSIKWPLPAENMILSAKDKSAPFLRDAVKF